MGSFAGVSREFRGSFEGDYRVRREFRVSWKRVWREFATLR